MISMRPLRKDGRRAPRDLPLTRLLPNMLTMMSFFGGLTAVRFAMQERWEAAALAIVIASIFDILDGRVARMLGATSKFGAELDSLADLTSFGVAPALVLYLWNMSGAGGSFGWGAALVFAACSALRLARFNTMLDDEDAPKWTKGYFVGVPAPAGAGLALLPLFIVLSFGEEYRLMPQLMSVWLIFVGGMMVSRVPTLAMKGRRISPLAVAPIMVGVCLLVAGLFTQTWLTLSVLGSTYFLTLPYGVWSYRRRVKKEKDSEGQDV
ncbi:MAG: CDP-diacylglycerol--serine O-phosphatidyltransferase [Proteobacteria bacterium]|nr:CDP-diacylglycerol--serine O-phosphatidyltransferase [Alphaproteobacteria bacterium]NCC02742.1 CDP-diacylglycerol--serine O-phosphatidyltransferase [Pseudomonadota bacterium]